MNKYIWIFLLLVCGGVTACSKQGAAGKGDPSGGSSKPTGGDAGSGGTAEGKSKSGATDTVKISRDDQQRGGITVAPIEVRSVARALTVTGQVEMDEQHTSHVGALGDGRITGVNVLPGAAVRRGSLLGTLHGHMVHETAGALAVAFAAVERQRGAVTFAQQARDRYSHLYSIQAASLEEAQRSEQDLLQARKQLADAEANVRMEREHLSELLQVAPESLTPATLYDNEVIPIRSPVDGVVIARNVTVGQVVPTGFETFVVSNLATVWVTGAVNEKDLSLVRRGATVEVTTQGYPKTVFHGQLAMLGDTLDPLTRTVPARIVVPNPGMELRPGMFATAQIAEPQTRIAIFVPQNALQDINGMQVVFVTRDGVTFRAQAVTVGTTSEGKTEVMQGLQVGDQVAVSGAFMVKSELLKGTMGEE